MKKYIAISALLALSACQSGAPVSQAQTEISKSHDMGHDTHEMNGSDHDSTKGPLEEFEIKFQAKVNGENFQCGQIYKNVGLSKSTLDPIDFRLYLSGIHLINTKGEHVPLALNVNPWQTEEVALLDFENKIGQCSSGTSETNMSIKGKAPQGDYSGIHFEMGVPFEFNHQDVSQADSPLNLSSLFWVWRAGYKFARIDFKSRAQPQGFFVHIGSTGCVEKEMGIKQHSGHSMGSSSTVSHCENPNRSAVTLKEFKPTQTIDLDLGTLLSQTDIDKNKEETAKGCQSSTDDTDCEGIFNSLGLTFGENKATEQNFFKVEQ